MSLLHFRNIYIKNIVYHSCLCYKTAKKMHIRKKKKKNFEAVHLIFLGL